MSVGRLIGVEGLVTPPETEGGRDDEGKEGEDLETGLTVLDGSPLLSTPTLAMFS